MERSASGQKKQIYFKVDGSKCFDPETYLEHTNKCYRMGATEETFNDAREICKAGENVHDRINF